MGPMESDDLKPRRYRVVTLPDGEDDSTSVQFATDDYDEAVRIFQEWVDGGQRGSRHQFHDGPNLVRECGIRGRAGFQYPVCWGRPLH